MVEHLLVVVKWYQNNILVTISCTRDYTVHVARVARS